MSAETKKLANEKRQRTRRALGIVGKKQREDLKRKLPRPLSRASSSAAPRARGRPARRLLPG